MNGTKKVAIISDAASTGKGLGNIEFPLLFCLLLVKLNNHRDICYIIKN